MFKFGFLFEKKKECKNPTIVIKPELPVFEWQKVEETGLEETITQATITLNQPEDVKVDSSRRNLRVNNNRSRSSSLNAESSRIRLMQIIEDEESRKIFRDYLVSQYCEENLDFYMDVANYREFFCTAGLHINEDMEEINSRAVYIWSEYLDDDTSPKSLNVPQDLVNTCRRKIEAKSHTIDVFDKLQEHCFGLMSTSDLSLSTGKIITNFINHNNNVKFINTVVNNDKNDVDNE
ncbi:2173_t:CDS:2 [Entrophospora sp. SA101]|nr:2173_t:CDS:2 [Entrophospora sp. SA101]CAJ0867321.1 3661_t:CDS:2 [Entrophospora sp. SA101]CAJ0914077.1 14561_t:CDS:2 [Entrophospora sp. SA101]CAJ0914109.1 14572_t:CDS:2 [Entrophospora sp. SA101]